MTPQQFINARKKLGWTQKQLAENLGRSIRAVQSYEQEWRKIPPIVEKFMKTFKGG